MSEPTPASSPRSMIADFVRGIVHVGFGNAAVLFLGLVGTMVVVRLLPVEDFGAFVLLYTVAEFLLQMSTLGLEEALPRFISPEDDPTQKRNVLNTALCLRLVATLVFSLIAWLSTPALASYFGESVVDLFPYLIAMFLLLGLGSLFRTALGSLFLFKRVGYTSVVQSASSIVLVVALVGFLKFGLLGLIYSRLISLALAAAYAWASIPQRPRLVANAGLARQLVSFGYPLHANSALTFLYHRVDTLMVGALLGPAQLAYYEVGRRIPDALRTLAGAFRTVYFPFIAKLVAKKDSDKVTELVNNSLRFVAVAGTVGALATLFLGRDLLVVLFSDRYAISSPVFVLSMLALAVSQVSTVLGYSLIAVGDRAKPLFINCLRASIVLGCNYILIPRVGIVGAAVAGLVGTVIANPVAALLLKRRIDFRTWEYVKPAAILVVTALTYHFLQIGEWTTGLRVAATVVMGIVVLGACAPRDMARLAHAGMSARNHL